MIQILKGVYRVPWRIANEVKEPMALLQLCEHQLVHTFRENNQVADFLANLDCSEQRTIEFLSFVGLPRLLKGLLRIDKSGIANLRCKGY